MSPLTGGLLGTTSNKTDVDYVTVELRTAANPNTVAYTYTGILQRNDTLICNFDPGATGNSYYLVVKHRNSLETWSANPVTITPGGGYDFTTGAGQAYGNNMAALGGGKYAIYSGDVDQDGDIDTDDKNAIQNALPSFIRGSYNVLDINGDGSVDAGDSRIIKNNIPLTIMLQRP
jgi:hypothetical protein